MGNSVKIVGNRLEEVIDVLIIIIARKNRGSWKEGKVVKEREVRFNKAIRNKMTKTGHNKTITKALIKIQISVTYYKTHKNENKKTIKNNANQHLKH